MHDSCEPAMFSLEQLLFAIASDQRSNQELLSQILPMLIEVYEKEKSDRKALKVSSPLFSLIKSYQNHFQSLTGRRCHPNRKDPNCQKQEQDCRGIRM